MNGDQLRKSVGSRAVGTTRKHTRRKPSGKRNELKRPATGDPCELAGPGCHGPLSFLSRPIPIAHVLVAVLVNKLTETVALCYTFHDAANSDALRRHQSNRRIRKIALKRSCEMYGLGDVSLSMLDHRQLPTVAMNVFVGERLRQLSKRTECVRHSEHHEAS